MKRLLASSLMLWLLLSAVVLVSCAPGEERDADDNTLSSPTETPPAPTTDETDEAPTYTETPNPRFDYKLPLPESYEGKVEFSTTGIGRGGTVENQIISVYHKATMEETEYPGWMFTIARYTPAEFEDYTYSIDVGGCYPFAKDEGHYYSFERPTDVQSTHEEYALLNEEIGTILEEFIAANGLEQYNYWSSIYTDPYFFPGMHIFLDVTLINDHKFRLAMSQPVTKGEGGVWCVDKMYGENGNLHLAIPKTDLTMAEYYSEKQAEADADPSKLQTPEEVARQYLDEVWGWSWEVTGTLFAGMYDPANIPPPQYTKAEIADACVVAEIYFTSLNAHDGEAFGKLWTPSRGTMSIVAYDVEFSDIELCADMTGMARDSYLTNGGGGFNGTLPNNCIVFKCDFTVTTTGEDTGSWEEMRYTDWSIIMIRRDIDSPWLIADTGY